VRGKYPLTMSQISQDFYRPSAYFYRMNIGFEAKRAFANTTGLGHYSRTLISSLARYYPDNDYFLFTPKAGNLYDISGFDNLHTVTPQAFPGTLFRSLWRSKLVVKDLKALQVDLYHGLSHELPHGIHRTGIRSVVTMHDLISERYPEQFNPLDVQIYRRKYQYACRHADRIIAISRQTRQDLVDLYHISPKKVAVCYQSCDPAFSQEVPETALQQIKEQYRLPDHFFLYVGSIIERKNLLRICEAYTLLGERMLYPLVVIGQGGAYKKKVQQYIAAHGLANRIIFLNDQPYAQAAPGFHNSRDLPAIYRLALAMVYPSLFEGFGIPVLEALCSRLPVITSNTSCLPEAGGDAAYYVDPLSTTEIASALETVAGDALLRARMTRLGLEHAANFTPEKCAAAVMQVYQEVL
jgi:glycosyltransferase involved in cell wall biosynthesis